jgi:predicted ATPase
MTIAQPSPTAQANPLQLQKPEKKTNDSQELPCLNSSSKCIELLAERAIANSTELVTLDEQIALIDKRLVVAGERIDHTSKKRWTNYLSTDPLRIAANLLGGGDVQRDNLAIADLEIKSAELETQLANLHRRQAEIKSELKEEILSLVLDYETAEREYALAQSKLVTYNQQRQLIEIDYQFGSGSTTEMLSLWQQGETLEAIIIQADNKRSEIVRKLTQLTGN